MAKQKIEIQGISITLDKINDENYISLTDIAKKQHSSKPKYLIRNWLKNLNTMEFLETWETLHNPNFKGVHLNAFKLKYLQNKNVLSTKIWVEETNAIGIISKAGRYGGTYAHKDIALNFCYWLSPSFQVYMIKAFQELMKQEHERNNLEWHISKITDNIDEVRNLLDTIPGQNQDRNRLKSGD